MLLFLPHLLSIPNYKSTASFTVSRIQYSCKKQRSKALLYLEGLLIFSLLSGKYSHS